MNGSIVRAAAIGGLIGGVLSALPIISAGNICCCLWVVSGGVVAAYVLQQSQSAPVTAGDGALAGLLAGVIGALVYLVLSIPMTLALAPVQRIILERLAARRGMPPEFRRYVTGYVGGLIGVIISFIAMLIAGTAFSTIGGLLGAAMFRKPQPTAVAVSSGVPEVPPRVADVAPRVADVPPQDDDIPPS